MDVTKHTFREELDRILAAIEESTFLAVDGEFTGLDAEGCSHVAPFDTPVERYAKLKNGSTDFMLIQFGLCAFKVNEEKQKYVAKPYNFYVFPTPFSRSGPDRRFMCQSSSIDFLVSYGFDFNKVFKEGIPYLSLDQELKLKAELESKHKDQNNHSASSITSPDSTKSKKTPMVIPEDQKEFIKDVCEKIDAFLDGDNKKPLELKACNAFQRKLVYGTVEEKYPLVHLETKTGERKERFLVVHKAQDAEELARKEKERQAFEMMELDIQTGFSKVIQAITKSEKLVVGHNMLLDIIHSVNQFHGPLPDDLDDFKSIVKTVFPKVLDTKLLANTSPFKDFINFSSLEEMRQTLQSKPFSPVPVECAPGFDAYGSNNDAPHEAGYDAFLTGCCFATMCKFLGSYQKPPAGFLLPSSQAIEPFVNKLFLMRIVDIPYLNISGPDLQVNRDHVFHVTFPKEWRSSDLYSLFEPYGNIQISWLSDTTAYVALHNKKHAKLAFEALSESKGIFHVVSYAFHHRNKAMSWSSAAKRKVSGEANFPPSKIKRHSLSHENSAVQENEQRLTQPNSTEGGVKFLQSPLAKESPSKELQSKEEKKLFDETTDW